MSIVGELFRIKGNEWTAEAICAQIGNWDLWFPDKGESSKDARRICVTACPVRAACLRFAMEEDVREGIFGGFSPRDREKLRKGRNPIRPAQVGTAFRLNGHGIACRCAICRRAA